ncbi:MAG: YsnF/AvaK domain-containing protein [Acidobacteriota bacterium]
MNTTLVAIFDDGEAARQAVLELEKNGINRNDVSIAENSAEGKGYVRYDGDNLKTGKSMGNKVSNFFDSIFGSDVNNDERDVYSEAVRRGSSTVIVNTDEAQTERAAEILNRSGAIDIDRRATQYRASGYEKFDEAAPVYSREQAAAERQSYDNQKEITLPVIEEQLNVGKRIVQNGGVRIHQRMTEVPVEKSVTLREEHVTVDRRPVDRAVSQTDIDASKKEDFVVIERAEEAVVGKQARVVEEVVVGKTSTERQETITDTTRRNDVEVEQTDATIRENDRDVRNK